MKSARLCLAAVLMLSLACCSAGAADSANWYRGNIHTHTLWSDGDQLPELVADWYKSNGYDFLVLSDHNVLSRGEKWKDVTKLQEQHKILDQVREKFGDVVTARREGDKTLVKLKTLEEVRKMVCQPGRFIMIEGDEITGSHDGRPAHANAINIERAILPAKGDSLAHQLALYAAEVKKHGQEIGKPVFMQVNHPNWQFSNTAEEVAHAKDADGVEIMNPNCGNVGDDSHPNVEVLWDVANTLRLKRDGWPALLGCATDDTHNYHEFAGAKANPGRAWVMVRSNHLSADAITKAMLDGDFYASTGVFLKDVRYCAETGTLKVVVDAKAGAEYRIDFIGSYRDADLTASPVKPMLIKRGDKVQPWPITARYSEQVGATFKSVQAAQATYQLTGREIYVRARVTQTNAKPLDWERQQLQPSAWTQPVGWRKYLAEQKPSAAGLGVGQPKQ